MLDADGATAIADIEQLEKAMDTLTKDHTVPAVVVGSRAHLQDEAVANVWELISPSSNVV